MNTNPVFVPVKYPIALQSEDLNIYTLYLYIYTISCWLSIVSPYNYGNHCTIAMLDSNICCTITSLGLSNQYTRFSPWLNHFRQGGLESPRPNYRLNARKQRASNNVVNISPFVHAHYRNGKPDNEVADGDEDGVDSTSTSNNWHVLANWEAFRQIALLNGSRMVFENPQHWLTTMG